MTGPRRAFVWALIHTSRGGTGRQDCVNESQTCPASPAPGWQRDRKRPVKTGTGQKFFLSPEIMRSLYLNVLNPSFSLGVKQALRLHILCPAQEKDKCILFEGWLYKSVCLQLLINHNKKKQQLTSDKYCLTWNGSKTVLIQAISTPDLPSNTCWNGTGVLGNDCISLKPLPRK